MSRHEGATCCWQRQRTCGPPSFIISASPCSDARRRVCSGCPCTGRRHCRSRRTRAARDRRAAEVATVQALLDAGPESAGAGAEATLARYGSVAWPSSLSMTCCHARSTLSRLRALLETLQGPCPVCGSDSIDTVEDVVELAIEQTLDEDGAFEMVRSAAARQMLAPIGPTAALLRW